MSNNSYKHCTCHNYTPGQIYVPTEKFLILSRSFQVIISLRYNKCSRCDYQPLIGLNLRKHMIRNTEELYWKHMIRNTMG